MQLKDLPQTIAEFIEQHPEAAEYRVVCAHPIMLNQWTEFSWPQIRENKATGEKFVEL